MIMNEDTKLSAMNFLLYNYDIPYRVKWLVGGGRLTPMFPVIYSTNKNKSVDTSGTLFRQLMRVLNVNNTKDMLDAPESVRQILVLANKIG